MDINIALLLTTSHSAGLHTVIHACAVVCHRPLKIEPPNIENCRIIDLPKISDPRGNLTFIESGQHIPFRIERVYYLYDVPGGASRAAHGHKKLHQLMIAMSGSFDVTLDDGFRKNKIHLNRSYCGLYIPPMIWRDLDNFSSGSVCMVLASEHFDESDYYRDYGDFLKAVTPH